MQCFAVFSVELTKVFALLICVLNTATNLAPGPADCYLNVRNTYVIDCVPRMVTQTRGEKKKTNTQIMSRLSSLPRFSGVQLNYNQKVFVKEESEHGMSHPKPEVPAASLHASQVSAGRDEKT